MFIEYNQLTGASDDNKTVTIWGSTLINFSGRGPTLECIMKPDIIAPGTDIVSCFTKNRLAEKRQSEIKIVDKSYVRMSGTSMSTPIISGAIALLVEKHPEITPDEVKYRLKSSVKDMSYSQNQQGWGLIDISKLLQGEIENVR